jgi:protein gp37
MGDLFHDAVDDGFIDEVFAAMALSSRHIFQVLTKRPKRMAVYCQDWQKRYSGVNYASRVVLVGGAALYPTQAHGMVPDRAWPPQNVWLGVSVEDQETADERIPLLLQTPAAVRFVSIELMLGPVDLSEWLRVHQVNLGPGRERHWTENNYEISKLDWIIVGGESGPDARPTHPDWVRSVRDQCQAAGVPFFMKQMSKRAPIPEDLAIRQFPDGK